MTPSVFRSLRFRLIASVVVIEIVMLSLLVWSNMGVIQQAYAERLQEKSPPVGHRRHQIVPQIPPHQSRRFHHTHSSIRKFVDSSIH